MKRWLTCLFISIWGFVAAPGCGSDDNTPPKWDPVQPDHQVAVGDELRIVLRASDPDGDSIKFSFKTDIEIGNRAAIEPLDGKSATFKWTPESGDVGMHPVDLIASDGTDSSRITVNVEVRSAIGKGTQPIFRQPLGTGTTLDLTAGKTCVTVPIEIEDQDSPGVQIFEEEPKIEGASLNVDSGFTGSWEWCPTQAQIDGGDLYQLKLSADDGDNPRVVKDYVIVLKKGQKQNCPGTAPVVAHTPADESTVVDLTISASISDDSGIKFALLLYSNTDPGPNPDLAAMTQVSMIQIEGDTWAADVPNPVAGSTAGTSQSLYYLIIARDGDECVTQAPDTGAYSMTVTNPGGSGSLGLCKSCTSDVQCGGENDHCIFVGSMGDTFCGKSCTTNADCGSPDYECSPEELFSIDWQLGRQCVPKSQTCSSSGACSDDSYEDNDTLTQAKSKSALPAGSHDMVSCPGPVYDDEDWYKIDITSSSTVTASIAGGSATDLDLFLKDSTGKILASSAKAGSNESLTTTTCLEPGTYYLHVYAWSSAKNTYELTWSKSGCAAVCQDDSHENDDSISQARQVDLNSGAYHSSFNAICAYDDDWYEVDMFPGETLVSTLDFIQTGYDDEVDVYIYDSTGKNLTPCCDPNNGQSSSSGEIITWDVTKAGKYYVVVRGWAGSENDYDICIDYETASHPAQCP